jgi:hypothetical protein
MRSQIVTDSQPTTAQQAATGERHLAEKLRLDCLPSSHPQEAVCFLCDDYFKPAGTIAVLYDGDMPMGYLCRDCATTPHKAALKVRRRIKRIQSLLGYKVDDDSAERSMKRLQLILRRAAYWKALANRLEKLASWD